MTYDQLINQISLRMGNRAGIRQIIIDTVEIVKQELENDDIFHPYFLLSEDSYYTVQSCEARIPVPEKFIAEYENGALWIEDEQFRQLRKAMPDSLDGNTQCSGTPEYYFQMGEYLRLFPTPDKEYIIRMYFYTGTDLLTNENNPWLSKGSKWLIWATCSLLAQSSRDRRWQEYEAKAAQARQDLMHITEERMSANFEYDMGSLTNGSRTDRSRFQARRPGGNEPDRY